MARAWGSIRMLVSFGWKKKRLRSRNSSKRATRDPADFEALISRLRGHRPAPVRLGGAGHQAGAPATDGNRDERETAGRAERPPCRDGGGESRQGPGEEFPRVARERLHAHGAREPRGIR